MSRSDFTTVRVVGGLLPPDLLGRVLAGDKDLGGLTGADYHLASGETPREAANRAWPYLLGAWATYRQALAKLPKDDAAVGLTREKWLTVLFKELDYGRLQPTPAGGIVVDDKAFPVSHLWGATPLHLLGWGVDLDKRTRGVPGAAERAPQAMVQELLNRTDQYLWAMLSNGRTIRLLRDSTSLAGQAYVEFDLESMFDGEVFSDFVLLYLLLHQSRVEVPDDGIPADCWLEKWRTSAAESGTRALGLLRDGVKDALEALGTGFLQAPGNDLNARLADGSLRIEDYHRALLRLVYRLLFLFVAEDRGLLLDPDADATAARRFQDYYSTARLRALARKRRGARHVDQWEALQLVITALGQVGGLPQLGLPGLGGIFNPEPIDVVMGQHLPNEALLTAVRKLSVVHPKGSPPRVVDYRNLGAEELGSIYESLLELVPRHDQLGRAFTLEALAGNERKTSGSYYTPSSLIDLVLDEALDPLLDERERDKDPEQALLSMTVCDPACGSGHFLVAAARRIATRLAAVRTGEQDPTPTDVQAALHDVVARCIYGVDLNPMAAELAKVSLWLEAMQPGRPLSFLDAHIKVGNALLGTTPELLEKGLPDEAFVALTGDDKKWVTALKKRNKAEREQSAQGELFDTGGLTVDTRALASQVRELEQSATGSLDDVHRIEQRYRDLELDPSYANARLVADAWCAAFVCPKTPDSPVVTHGVIEQLQADRATDPLVRDAVHRIAVEYGFFHWYLEFPQVFGGEDPGFTCVIGNPPWERIKLQEQEFFATRDEAIAAAENAAARKKMIRDLVDERPDLHQDYVRALRRADGEGALLRNSGRFPFCGQGDVNTYSVFAEMMSMQVCSDGRSGFITPTGLVTDATTAPFFAHLVVRKTLVAVLDFVTNPRLWSDVGHRQLRFAITIVTGGLECRAVRMSFQNKHPDDLGVPGRIFDMPLELVEMINPNTLNCPTFQSSLDAQIASSVYRRFGVLVRESGTPENHWGLGFSRLFDMANDSHRFLTRVELESTGHEYKGWSWDHNDELLPLLEAKLMVPYDYRHATYAGRPEGSRDTELPRLTDAQHDDPSAEPLARYWLRSSDLDEALRGRWSESWMLGWRDVARTTDARTFRPVLFPRACPGGVWSVFPRSARDSAAIQAIWGSFMWDYLARQKITGAHATLFVAKQIAMPTPSEFEDTAAAIVAEPWTWIVDRVRELAYTSWRLSGWAKDLGQGGPPFRWSEKRRQEIRSELDALVFHIYGLKREDVVHVLGTFGSVKRAEETATGNFLSLEQILVPYDLMAEAMAARVPYQTPIDPPPGQGPRHDESTRPDWLKE
jgi:hypothetical protein